MVELPGGLDVRISPLLEHGLELWLIGLPRDDAEIRLAQVGVEDGESRIWYEESSNVWKSESGIVIISTFRDILKICPASEGVFRGRESIRLSAADVIACTHTAIHVQ